MRALTFSCVESMKRIKELDILVAYKKFPNLKLINLRNKLKEISQIMQSVHLLRLFMFFYFRKRVAEQTCLLFHI